MKKKHTNNNDKNKKKKLEQIYGLTKVLSSGKCKAGIKKKVKENYGDLGEWFCMAIYKSGFIPSKNWFGYSGT